MLKNPWIANDPLHKQLAFLSRALGVGPVELDFF
jgi:hypothetical protein